MKRLLRSDWFVVFFVLGAAFQAFAHGPAPTALSVIAYPSNHTPTIVRLSRGLAIQQSNGWQFVCPAAWNGPEAPLSASANTANIPWLVSATGLRRVQNDGSTEVVEGSEALTSGTVRALVPWNDSVFALTGFGKPSTVWQLSEQSATPVWQAESTWESIVGHGDQLVAAAIEAGQVQLAFVTFGEAEPTVALHSLGADLQGTLSLRSTGGSLFVRVHHVDTFTLYRVDEPTSLTLLLTSDDPIHGPIGGDDGASLIVAINHQMATLGSSGAVPWETPERITCLGQDGHGHLYACIFPNLVTVLPTDQLGDPLFELHQIQTPAYAVLTEGQQALCELDWLDLLTDAGLPLEGMTGDDPGAPQSGSSSSCALLSSPHPSTSPFPLLILLGVLVLLWIHGRRKAPWSKGSHPRL